MVFWVIVKVIRLTSYLITLKCSHIFRSKCIQKCHLQWDMILGSIWAKMKGLDVLVFVKCNWHSMPDFKTMHYRLLYLERLQRPEWPQYSLRLSIEQLIKHFLCLWIALRVREGKFFKYYCCNARSCPKRLIDWGHFRYMKSNYSNLGHCRSKYT